MHKILQNKKIYNFIIQIKLKDYFAKKKKKKFKDVKNATRYAIKFL